MEARAQRWGMMYMKVRSGHWRAGSVMKKPEKRKDANLRGRRDSHDVRYGGSAEDARAR